MCIHQGPTASQTFGCSGGQGEVQAGEEAGSLRGRQAGVLQGGLGDEGGEQGERVRLQPWRGGQGHPQAAGHGSDLPRLGEDGQGVGSTRGRTACQHMRIVLVDSSAAQAGGRVRQVMAMEASPRRQAAAPHPCRPLDHGGGRHVDEPGRLAHRPAEDARRRTPVDGYVRKVDHVDAGAIGTTGPGPPPPLRSQPGAHIEDGRPGGVQELDGVGELGRRWHPSRVARLLRSPACPGVGHVVAHGLGVADGDRSSIVSLDLLQRWRQRAGEGRGDQLTYHRSVRTAQRVCGWPCPPAEGELQAAQGVGQDQRRHQVDGQAQGSQLAMSAAAGRCNGRGDGRLRVCGPDSGAAGQGDGAVREDSPSGREGVLGGELDGARVADLRGDPRPLRRPGAGQVATHRPAHRLQR